MLPSRLLTALLVLLAWSGTAPAAESVWDRAREAHAGARAITVYRSPTCGCCGGWIEHLRAHGFTVDDQKVADLGAVKRRLGVPADMGSCHTAVIDGYLVEGHVPADDIKKLLKDRPAVAGLAVPAMPVGSPGMEAGDRKDPFSVFAFSKDGSFTSYRDYWNY